MRSGDIGMKHIGTILSFAGIDVRRIASAIIGWPRFIGDYNRFRKKARSLDKQWHPRFFELMPILHDWRDKAGTAGGHYFCQDLWAARRIFQRRPLAHVDIGSRVDGFVAHLLTFMPVFVVDIRPLPSNVEGLTFMQADATSLSNIDDDSIESLSSLHAIEHFGLGRYGDPIDPAACFNAMRSLARVLKPSGHLYFSVPVGRERVEFNAHRVFAPETIINLMRDAGLALASFSAVDDAGVFHPDCDIALTLNANYACGMFEFTK